MDFSEIYKQNIDALKKQNERRQISLAEHKENRLKLHDENRKDLTEFLKRSERYKNWRTKKLKFNEKYKIPHQLQLSEWLTEKPDDLAKWYLVPCPKGQRCLAVASNNITEVYNKKNKLMFSFHSKLPGDSFAKNEFSLIDCIYSSKQKIFYVLDVIYFGKIDLTFCEASFRHYWAIKSFQESEALSLDSEAKSKNCFIVLNWIDFEDVDLINLNFQKFPYFLNNGIELDGFLFYHKEASYTFGTTPLVGWLYPFMVPEVLGINVNSNYMLDKPENYQNYLQYVEWYENQKIFDIKRKKLDKEELDSSNELEIQEDCMFIDQIENIEN